MEFKDIPSPQLTANASESQAFLEYELPFGAIGLFFKGEMAVSFRLAYQN